MRNVVNGLFIGLIFLILLLFLINPQVDELNKQQRLYEYHRDRTEYLGVDWYTYKQQWESEHYDIGEPENSFF